MTLLSNIAFLSMRPKSNKRTKLLAQKNKKTKPNQDVIVSSKRRSPIVSEKTTKTAAKNEDLPKRSKTTRTGSANREEKGSSNTKKRNEDSIIESELVDIIRKQREIFNSQPLSKEDNNTIESVQPEDKIQPPPQPPPVTKGKRGRPRKVDKLESKTNLSKPDLEPPRKKQKKEPSELPKNDSNKTENNSNKTDNEDELSGKGTDTEIPIENKKSSIGKSSKENSSSFVVFVTKDERGAKSKVFKCRICNKEASAKADLIKHIRVHTGERPFKCKVCDASFVQVTALRGHETIHSGEKPFNCDVCGKKFAIKDRLRLHMRVHTGEKPHQCPHCDLSFARRSQVSQHMRIHDTVKNKFKCDECGSSFASYHTLKAHVNSHLGIKEFQCFACGKKFLRVEGMYKHIRTVHRGNRPYTCNICGKAFKGHLQQHMRLHRGVRPYTCHLCDAAFTQNSQLTVHLRIHTGERPYKCQVCGSSFAHSSACKIHMRSHTGEKPFKCVLCNHSFSQLPHLKKHMKCVHGADKPYMCMLCKEFFKTQAEIDAHRRFSHNVCRSAEEEAQETVEEATLARLRNRLAVLLYRISSEDRRTKFGFGSQLIDGVLKLSLESSGHVPISDSSLTRLEELRQNVLQLLRWTIPQETMEEYHKNNMTVDEVLDMLTS